MKNQTSGILIIDKPKGLSSAQVVGKVKRLLKLKKVGHGGTLDPMATGVLPLCVNQATKISSFLFDSDKGYEGVMELGVETDTQDIIGTILKQCDTSHILESEILKTIETFKGELEQMPPMYSALKKDGKPLYKYARENKEVERPLRRINIFSFTVLKIEGVEVSFRVHCSKGTYIRTLCHDIGQRLGVGATLKKLRRTQTGSHKIESAVSLDGLSEQNAYDPPHWHALGDIFKRFPFEVADEDLSKRVRNGHWPLFREFDRAAHMILSQKACLLDDKQGPLALMEPDHQGQVFKLLRVFN